MLSLVVMTVALFGGYLYWLKSSSSSIELAKKQQLSSQKRQSGEDQFHFDFFSMLPEEEYIGVEEKPVVVKKGGEKSRKSEQKQPLPAAQKVTKRSPTGNYLIQMGAFRSQDSAEQHKAELILMGIESVQIKSVRSSKGALYRVNVGPFQSFSSAEHQQALLKRAGYDSFLKKYSSH